MASGDNLNFEPDLQIFICEVKNAANQFIDLASELRSRGGLYKSTIEKQLNDAVKEAADKLERKVEYKIGQS